MESVLISECEFIAQGKSKRVYKHPNWPDAVLKIVRPNLVEKDFNAMLKGKIRNKRPLGIYRHFNREFLQFFILCRRNPDVENLKFPISTPLGLINTDQGLAILSESICSNENELGPDLKSLMYQGKLEQEHVTALETFFQNCLKYHVVIHDGNPTNLIYTTKRTGKPEFVLVDGFGERSFFRLYENSKKFNDRNIKKLQAKILGRVKTIFEKNKLIRKYMPQTITPQLTKAWKLWKMDVENIIKKH